MDLFHLELSSDFAKDFIWKRFYNLNQFRKYLIKTNHMIILDLVEF